LLVRPWQTGAQYIGTYPLVGDNAGKLVLIPHKPERGKIYCQRNGLYQIR
jgi:hypothetical protein